MGDTVLLGVLLGVAVTLEVLLGVAVKLGVLDGVAVLLAVLDGVAVKLDVFDGVVVGVAVKVVDGVWVIGVIVTGGVTLTPFSSNSTIIPLFCPQINFVKSALAGIEALSKVFIVMALMLLYPFVCPLLPTSLTPFHPK